MDELISKCLERDPNDRIQTASELKKRLGDFLKTQGNPGRDDVSQWLKDHCQPLLEKKKKVEQQVRRESARKEREDQTKKPQSNQSIGSLILHKKSEHRVYENQASFSAPTKITKSQKQPTNLETHVSPASTVPKSKRWWLGAAITLTCGAVLGFGITTTFSSNETSSSPVDSTIKTSLEAKENAPEVSANKGIAHGNKRKILPGQPRVEAKALTDRQQEDTKILNEPAKKKPSKKRSRKNGIERRRDKVKNESSAPSTPTKRTDLHDPWQD